MADMIDAKEAKQILGCDDEALNRHINGNVLRANRVGGKLMVNKEDVQKLAAEQDDGTIVLTGDSDSLQIDLGKVVDETSETIVQDKGATKGPSDSITFGDELEVINFDDKGTQEMGSFDDSKKTMDLNFTDQNTAVMTAVDETGVGATTAQLDTSNDAGPAVGGSAESRRSVRSNRVRVEIAPVHPMWVAFMAVTTLIMAFLVFPYQVLGGWARVDEKDARGAQRVGVDDGFWTSIASTASGFSVEPDKTAFDTVNPGKEFVKNPDPAADFRYVKYRGTFKGDGEKRDSYLITRIDKDQAYAKDDKAHYNIVQQKTTTANGDISEETVDIGLNAPK